MNSLSIFSQEDINASPVAANVIVLRNSVGTLPGSQENSLT